MLTKYNSRLTIGLIPHFFVSVNHTMQYHAARKDYGTIEILLGFDHHMRTIKLFVGTSLVNSITQTSSLNLADHNVILNLYPFLNFQRWTS